MEKDLLFIVRNAVERKGIELKSIKVYDRKFDDGSGTNLIVINDLYEFHIVGGFKNWVKSYSIKGSLKKLDSCDKKGIKYGYYMEDLFGKNIICTYILIEEIR